MSQRNVPNNVLLTWQRTMIMINCFSIYRTTVKTIQTKYELLIPKGSNHLLINTNLFLFSTQDMFHIAFILLSYMYIFLGTCYKTLKCLPRLDYVGIFSFSVRRTFSVAGDDRKRVRARKENSWSLKLFLFLAHFFRPSPTTESLEQAKLYGPQDHTKTIELSARPYFLTYCLYQISEKKPCSSIIARFEFKIKSGFSAF